VGGPGGGTNPEQFFAAGYAACVHGTLSLIAAKRRVKLADVSVNAKVTFGRDPSDGLFLISADLTVALPDLDEEIATSPVREKEAICPYARISRVGFRNTVSIAR